MRNPDRAPFASKVWFQEGPGLRKWQWRETGVKVINGTNIREDGRFDPSNSDKYLDPEECRTRYDHFMIEAGDIVLSSSGTLGKIGVVGYEHLPMVMNTSVIRLRTKDPETLENSFLLQWLKSHRFLNQILPKATGAAQQNFGPSHLHEIEVDVPTLHAQRWIAGILSAYDSLMENNTRRIEILEEMARGLFEEWFVRGRFQEIQGSTDEWVDGVIGDVFTLQRGFDLPSAERGEGTHPVIAASGIHGYHNEYKVRAPGVVTGRSGTIGKFLFVEEDFWPLNTTLWIKEFKYGGPLYSFYLLSSLALGSSNTGAAVPSLNRNVVHAIPTRLPPLPLVRAFEGRVAEMRLMISNLTKSNTNLRATRDFLLPKLISGEIEVRAAEEALEAAAG